MKTFLLAIVLIAPYVAGAQTDSLPTLYLNGITLQSVRTEGDTLQSFFKANKSATTESILARMQGVSLVRRGSYGHEPMIHGMTAGQLNVTIDGMKMFGACTDKMDPVTIYVEPQNLKSINAALGTNGSSLGTTVGGSIDMKLAEPRLGTTGYRGTMGSGYQSASQGWNLYSQSNYAWTKSAMNANLIYRKSSNYTDGNGDEVPYSQYEKLNLSAGLKTALNSDTLRADILIDEGRNIGFPALPMDVGFASAQLLSFTLDRQRTMGLFPSTKVKLYANRIMHSMDDSQREDVVMHMDMPGRSHTLGACIENYWRNFGKHTPKSRVDFYHNEVLAEMTMYPEGESPMYMQTWPESRRSVTGLYLADAIRLSPGWRIDIDGRVDVAATYLLPGIGRDQLLVFYPALEERATTFTTAFNTTLSVPLSESIKGQLHAGYGERLPTTSELFGFYLFNRQDGYDYLGNPELKTEKSWAGDMTLSYFGKRLELQGHLFYQHCPDYVTAFTDPSLDPMTPGAHGVKVYDNIGYAVYTGFDAMVSIAVTRNLQLLSTFKATYAQTRDDDPLPFIPPLKNVTSVLYRYGDFSLQGEYEGSAAQNRVSSGFGEASTAAYHLFNVRAGYAWKFREGKLIANAGVENIGDVYYRDHLDWGGIPRPGRNVYATVEISF